MKDPVKPVAGTNLGEVGFSSTPVTSRDTGWSAAENDSKGQQVVLASGFSCASTARPGAGWLAAETDLEDQHASAGESKETIGLHEVVATTAGAGWLAAETDLEDQHASAGESKETIGLHEVVATTAGGRGWLETVGSETADQAGVLHGTSSLFLNSRIPPHGHRSRIHGLSRFHMHVHAWLLLLCLLVLLLGLLPLLLPLLHGFHARLLQLLLMLQVHVPHLCMIVHLIQGVLVVCCLCANPPVTIWRCVARVPGAGGVPKVGFPVQPKICVLSQRWRQG